MEDNRLSLWQKIKLALYNARKQIWGVAITYVAFVSIGIFMAHTKNQFALNFRDKIVAKAQSNDRASIAYRQGNNFKAAVIDFGQNLVLGAGSQTITGLTVVSPYGFAAFRGWVGGIVSVDSQHKSRLANTKKAVYYFVTLILQLIPYSLAGGIGVKLGLSYFKKYPEYSDNKRYWGYPNGALKDVAFVYILIAPMFFIASLWEFLSPWN
jgi:hypothetical protein